MNHKKMTRRLTALLTMILCFGLLPIAALAEGGGSGRTQTVVDESVDTSATQVVGVLETDKATYENTASIHDDSAWTTSDGSTYKKTVYISSEIKVDYEQPCPESIEALLAEAKAAVDADGAACAAQPNLSYAGADTKYADKVSDNRSYQWLGADEAPAGDADRTMYISGDYGRKRVYTITGVIHSSADAHSHSGTFVPEMPATAEKEGRKAHYQCDCGKLFSDEACANEVTAEELVIPKLAPTLLAGENGQFTKGDADGLAFKSSAALEDLVSVSVDGAVLDEDVYTKASGSTIIDLKPAYLNTLPVGEHILTITSQTGAVEARFKVAEKPTDDRDDDQPTKPVRPQYDTDVPKTGDNSHRSLCVLLLLLSGLCLAVSAVCGRRNRTTR